MQTGFECQNCHKSVPVHEQMGVKNRNHCPFCLYSKHVDKRAGDRSEKCQGLMKPIGLTFKQARQNKYGHSQGELMIIHQCQSCNQFSINRIAADDSNERIQQIFQTSLRLAPEIRKDLVAINIDVLMEEDKKQLDIQLFGLK